MKRFLCTDDKAMAMISLKIAQKIAALKIPQMNGQKPTHLPTYLQKEFDAQVN